MQRYEPSAPRGVLAALALTMTAVTMTALVFAPAGLEAVEANRAALSRVTPRSLIHMALAAVVAEAVSAGQSRRSSTRSPTEGKS
jgi:hypothetical protein